MIVIPQADFMSLSRVNIQSVYMTIEALRTKARRYFERKLPIDNLSSLNFLLFRKLYIIFVLDAVIKEVDNIYVSKMFLVRWGSCEILHCDSLT